MKTMLKLLVLPSTLLVCTLLTMGGCGGDAANDGADMAASATSAKKAGDGPLTIYTVNYPLQYFAQRIGGTQAKVVFPAPDDVDPAFWNPSAEEVSAFQAADLILLNGASYAKWVPKVSLPVRKLIDTSASFRDDYIQIESAATHSHGPGGDHAHTGTAFTTWLDPQQASAQARAVATAMQQARPDLNDLFATNLARLVADLEALDTDLRELTAGKQDRPLLASHPVYQYLARRYDLNLAAVMWEPDAMPTHRQWQDLAGSRADHPSRWMIWEGEPLVASVARLEEMTIGSLVFDPCGNVPEEGDYLSIMQRNVQALAAAFEDVDDHVTPTPCSAAWYRFVERKVGITDGQGHGPDLGSGEWRSAVEFKLGIRDDPAVPELDSPKWCAYIDTIIQKM